MTIAIEPADKAHTTSLQAQVNSSNTATVETEVLAIVNQGAKSMLLNMTALSYISSAGLREVFNISGFLAILNVTATRAEALAQF